MSALPGPPANPPPDKPQTPRLTWLHWVLLGAGLVAMGAWQRAQGQPIASPMDYSAFLKEVKDGNVEDLTVEGQKVTGLLKRPVDVADRSISQFRSRIPERDTTLWPLLHERVPNLRVRDTERPLGLQLIVSMAPWLLLILVWFWLSRQAGKLMGGRNSFAGGLKGRNHKFEKNEHVDVSFQEVAGLQSAKRDLQEIVGFLQEPTRYQRLGAKVPRGVLLVGPPGTGKTLLARAVAGEAGVAFYSISASEFIEMFVGVGASRVRELFAEAKKNSPAIVFIDEIDAVGRSRGTGMGGGNDEREQTLNQLLAEMDGFERNDLTIVLAATNRPDVLDPALTRPGRFDRQVLVDKPELQARREILTVHLRGKPIADDVDLRRLAQDTPRFSGADLANLVNEAALTATRSGAELIAAEHFEQAYEKVVLGDPRETKLPEDERIRIAAHESGHAIVAHFGGSREGLRRVSILPRGMALGITQQSTTEDRHLLTQPELEAELRVLMGGRAAEQLVLGSVSSGAANDLKRATEIAFKMVAQFGMSEHIGPVHFEHNAEHPFLGQALATNNGTSDLTEHALEKEVRALLLQAQQEAKQLLDKHRNALDRLSKALLDEETLEGTHLLAVLAPTDSTPQSATPNP